MFISLHPTLQKSSHKNELLRPTSANKKPSKTRGSVKSQKLGLSQICAHGISTRGEFLTDEQLWTPRRRWTPHSSNRLSISRAVPGVRHLGEVLRCWPFMSSRISSSMPPRMPAMLQALASAGRHIRYVLRDKDWTRKLVRRRRREISLLPGPFRASDLICGTYFAPVSSRPCCRPSLRT